MRVVTRLIAMMLGTLACAVAWSGPLNVVCPAGDSPDAAYRFDDLREILRGALDETVASFGPYTLTVSPRFMDEARYLNEVRHGGVVNIAWTSTSIQKERDLLPIRFDLRKGLLGYRISLIEGSRQPEFDRIHRLSDLKSYTVGQGIGWGDSDVYRAAGVSVAVAAYDDLFRMVANHRFDLFPRGVGEVFGELALYRKYYPKLAVERHLLIYYPWPYYFFVNRQDTDLAKRIQTGLLKMAADGNFDRLFWKYNRKAIVSAHLGDRQLIVLPNPWVPKTPPLNEPYLWNQPVPAY